MTPTPQQAPLKALLRYASRYGGRIKAAITCSILNKIFDLAPPALIGMAVDVVVKKDQSFLASLGVETLMTQLWILGILTVIVWGLESVFEYAFQTLWRNLAQTIQHDMRLDAYAHIQTLDMSYFHQASTGRLMAVLNNDVNQLERFLDGGANALLQVGTTVIAVCAVFFYLSPGIAALAMIPIPLIVWGSFLFQKRIAPRYAAVREDAAQVNSLLSNNLSGIEVIKAFTAEGREVERVKSSSDRYRTSNLAAIKLSSAFSPLIRMVIVVGFTATLVYGGWLCTEGRMEVGAYSVLVFLTQRLLWPLTRLGTTVDLYQRAMASTERVLGLLAVRPDIVTGDQKPTDIKGHIAFEGVRFAYPEREPVLTGFDLEVPAGSTLAVVGSTGSGKSTLVRLLLRFHDPLDGKVTLDGADLRSLDLDTLRQSIGLVSQAVFLFPGSVEDNIAYGRPGASREAVIEAAKMSEAHDFIMDLPEGYDTLIGERGLNLSGGQRQRLSIARALIADPPILVLDEATSAVDNETEAAIQRSLQRVSVGRTTILIAHRLSTIRHADRIIVVERGEIVESGTHDHLVEQDGRYAALWKVQTGVVSVDPCVS